MTIGQRIADQRKKLGLSQEALGERLGVSRQAISKWESDTSVPEIDNLIVLSKLFSVSVGWLLGVEAAQDMPAEAVVPEEERQESLWQWVLRWLKGWELPDRQEVPSRLRAVLHFLTPRRLGILLLVLTQLFLGLWTLRNHNLAASAQLEALIAKNTADSLRAEVQSLQNVLGRQTLSDAAPGTLLSDYTFQIDPAADTLTATVTFSAVPHSWQEGTRGYLCISGKGVEPLEIPCRWDGAFFRCAAVLELTENIQLCFALEYEDGSRQLQLLSAPELENGTYTQPPVVSGSIGGLLYNPKTQLLLLQELDVTFQRTDVSANTAVTWQTQSIMLLADEEEAARYCHFDADSHPHDSSFTSAGTGFYTREKSMSNVILTEGQQVELVLYAELSNGLSAREVIGTWTVDTNGTLIPAG